jgi:serine/threonine protein kinase
VADDDPTRRVPAECTDNLPTVRGLAAGQKVFGRYVLEAVLGKGGMGVVWRAHDEELGNPVALKFLPEIVARDDAAVDELKEETRNALRLTHPNIVRIHHFERDGNIAAVSMEFVDGVPLSKLRLAQPGKVFSVEKLAPLVTQLCAALDYAHCEAKIVHRDLKPANVIVTREGRLKIADFGIARSLADTHTRLTGRTVGTSGTLLYMSPQ